MGKTLRKLTLSVLLAGLTGVLMAPAAEANRGNGTTTTTEPGYVPPYGQNPRPELPDEPDPYGNPVDIPDENPFDTVAPVVPVELPAVGDPGAGLAGGGSPLDDVAPRNEPGDQEGARTEAPAADDGFFGGILSRTGAETLPLARAGLAAVALGIGLVVLARRRRVDAASV